PITTTYNPPIAAPAADTADDSLAPYNLSATAVSANEIDLTWSSPAQIGSAAYRIDVCEQINGVWKEIGLTNQSNTFKVTGLQPGTKYQFEVGTPNNLFGNGEDYSGVASATTASVSKVLPPPTGFAGQASSPSQVNLTWNPVSGATGYVIDQ